MNLERFMRIFHRWISLPVAIFMAGIAVTGIILHFQLIENPPGQGAPGPGGQGAAAEGMPGQEEGAEPAMEAPPADAPEETRTPLSQADAQGLLATAFAKDNTLSAVTLENDNGQPVVEITAIDGSQRRLTSDGSELPPSMDATANPARPMQGPPAGGMPGGMPGGPSDASMKAHKFIMSLHTGDFMGPYGKYIAIFCGFALVILSLSGLWMYIQMFVRRFQQGRKGLFWS